MKPTNELRFVRRELREPPGGERIVGERMILQQKWASEWESIDGEPRHEWRDVPVGAE